MDFPVVTYTLLADEIEIDEKEVLRYLGYARDKITPEDIALVRRLVPSVREVAAGRACYGRYPLRFGEDGTIFLPYGEVQSRDLTRNLKDCIEIYLFAATIGLGFDRLLQRTRLKSMADAAVLQAIGAAAVENVCDRLNAELAQAAEKDGFQARPRYSPGYGDYVLENQKGIFAVLNPSKHCGISLKDNLIMAPEKSVTAVIGLCPGTVQGIVEET